MPCLYKSPAGETLPLTASGAAEPDAVGEGHLAQALE